MVHHVTLSVVLAIHMDMVQFKRHLNYAESGDHQNSSVLDSIVVSIPACHAGDRGSIPRRGDYFLLPRYSVQQSVIDDDLAEMFEFGIVLILIS